MKYRIALVFLLLTAIALWPKDKGNEVMRIRDNKTGKVVVTVVYKLSCLREEADKILGAALAEKYPEVCAK
jgi:hypothetical protein